MAKRDRRVEIMRAAERFLTTRQYHEISLDDVVRSARVGKGTIYRYFRNKEDLFFQTTQSGFDELCRVIRHEVPDDASFSKQLLSMCRKISRFFARRRQLLRMMQTEQGRKAHGHGQTRSHWREHKGRLVDTVAVVLAKGIDEHRVRSDIPPQVLARHLLGMLRTRAWTAAQTSQEPEPLETVIDLFCNGAFERSEPAAETAVPIAERIGGGDP